MCRDIDVNYSSRSEFHEEEIHLQKQEVDDGQEIASPDVLDMILEKQGPGLTRSTGRTHLPEVFSNGGFGDLDVKLEDFASNAFCSPRQILLGHVLNKVDGVNR